MGGAEGAEPLGRPRPEARPRVRSGCGASPELRGGGGGWEGGGPARRAGTRASLRRSVGRSVRPPWSRGSSAAEWSECPRAGPRTHCHSQHPQHPQGPWEL
ncbi:hypothetical protein JD844_030901 [Phrynosoma platyrhinos]|uniref:Uncharacterized protein n=1 Tax=Phrynosoma platyrhinos TaxID=52577 RepID=A0ABQ7T0D1_PHRPL|nr:hypothetical protein JD844_030901 [Phrynosoma platyrhinos]